ncbi:MAG: GNAT family N-acetyltransferase [Defluviitaleaceae bacterium]|nr:GNAT family N-acetyltransferase [Defluviitaleaceae bacterium]
MNITFDTTNIKIETARLALRPFVESDLDDLYAYASVKGVGEMAGWPHHKSIEESRKILHMFMRDKNVLAIFHKCDKKVIGSIGLHPSWANKDDRYKHLKLLELGYALSKDCWGQGIVAEASKVVIDYCFDRLGLEAIASCHFVENSQSKRVLEKLGFGLVGKGTYHSTQLNKNFDSLRYILMNRGANREI